MFNDRLEFDHLAIEPAHIEACDPTVLRMFLFRRHADLIETYSALAETLDELSLLLLCDVLYRTWDYRVLAGLGSTIRRRITTPSIAKRADNMLRRAQISSGDLSEGERDLAPLAVGSLADFLLRGDVWNASGRMDLATEAYRRAIHAQSDNPMARLHYGFHLLKKGQIAEGLVCWGLAERIFGHFPLRFPQPPWRGEPLDGKRILIVFEHGFGDMIQFARYLVPLQRRYPLAHIIGLVPAPIAGLFAQSFPALNFISDKSHAAADFHIAVTQLPLVLDAPMYEPRRYLSTRKRRGGATTSRDRLRVGVCWRGHPRQYEQSRSIAVDMFSRLFAAADVEFVSLLNTLTSTERTHLAQFANVSAPPISDFLALAETIADCDLVVTVDTSIVHLAGALGKRTILLSRPDACWRWGASGTSSLWYDDVSVVRHPLDLDWPHVLAAARVLIEAAREPKVSRSPVPALT